MNKYFYINLDGFAPFREDKISVLHQFKTRKVLHHSMNIKHIGFAPTYEFLSQHTSTILVL